MAQRKPPLTHGVVRYNKADNSFNLDHITRQSLFILWRGLDAWHPTPDDTSPLAIAVREQLISDIKDMLGDPEPRKAHTSW